MNFKIGDRVTFLNEKGGGIISKIINKTEVLVTLEDGLEIPYSKAELVLLTEENNDYRQKGNQSLPKKTEEKQAPVKIKSERSRKAEGIYIAFSPENFNNIEQSGMNVWIINYTGYKVLFTFSFIQHDKCITIESGMLAAYESVIIETVSKKDIESLSNLKVEALFYNDKEHIAKSPLSELIKFKIVKLYKDDAFTENEFIAEKALVIHVSHPQKKEKEDNSLNKADLSELLFQKKNQSSSVKESKPHTVNNPEFEMEIDIHIEELMENYSHLSNAEIITVQLKHFENALDKAIAMRYRKLIVIHGVGNGRLKNEVRNTLMNYENVKFYDASYARYGFGATEISIS